MQPAWKLINDLIKANSMSNPPSVLKLPALQLIDNSPVVFTHRVATETDSQFPTVCVGIIESDVALIDADKDQTSAVRHKLKRGGHRLPTASRVEDYGRQFARRHCL